MNITKYCRLKGELRFNYDIIRVGRVSRMKARNLSATQSSFCADETMLNVYRERARMAFEYADTRFERALNKRQYQIAMTAVFGYFPDKMEVKHVLRSRTDGISYDEFEYWVSKKCDASNPTVNADTLFSLLDRNYRGYLLLEDFCFASKAAGLRITLPVWQRVFKELDHREKGYIEPDEIQCGLLAP